MPYEKKWIDICYIITYDNFIILSKFAFFYLFMNNSVFFFTIIMRDKILNL